MTIILGAGLAGLSCAFHLDKDYALFEREQSAGGLCRTRHVKGYSFDYTGHLLHLRNDYTKGLIAELLPDAFRIWPRSAWIYSHGVSTPYPFQANTHGLPPVVVKECLLGYFEAREAGEASTGDDESFEHWVLRTFGSGYAKYFMFPYNEKLWQTPAAGMTADWVSWSVPRPEPEDVINGALGITNRAFGYNPEFLYPAQGGIEQLPLALAARVKEPHLEKEAVRVRPARKEVCFSDGTSERYDFLVSTLPLPALFSILEGVPEQLATAVAELRSVSVLDINLGIAREKVAWENGVGKHWIYFPEPRFPFYRVGFSSNFSNTVAPGGASSLYVEVSHRPENPLNHEQTLEAALDGLVAAGILTRDDRVDVADIVDIPSAYVVYDRHRQKVLPEAHSYLESLGIYSTGRYGAWVYGSMEDAILQGKGVAEKIRGRMGEG